MKKKKAPVVTIPRLSFYYRALMQKSAAQFISSQELAKLCGTSAAQVRKDLAYFGQFGAAGKGYRVDFLKNSISRILGVDKNWPVALVGIGNLGSALLSYRGFSRQGFEVVAAFDNDRQKIGKDFSGIVVSDIAALEEEVKFKKIKMAVVTVPQQAAQSVIDKLAKAGIKAVLNFAPIRPDVPKSVEVHNIDLSIELERLAYFLSK
jgi:redox-sensing transcriptional repressor